MYPEYLYNNDTKEIECRVGKMAASDEPALRAQCLEVSRQTDTSSLALQEECVQKANTVHEILMAMAEILKDLLQSLSSGGTVFGTENGKADFAAICQTIVRFEEERLRLLSNLTELTKTRQAIFLAVAEANRGRHFLSLAQRAVREELRPHYTEAIERINAAYTRLTEADVALREAQSFYMTFIESHLPVFMQRLRTAADFNHAGAALERAAVRTLCSEVLILINRAPNVTF